MRQISANFRTITAAIGATLTDQRNVVSDMLIERIRRRFTTKRDLKGHPWRAIVAGNFPRTTAPTGGAVLRPTRSQVLVNTGLLRDSIKRVGKGERTPLKKNTGAGFRIGVVGPASIWGTIMQKGGMSFLPGIRGHRIPPREFLGITKKDADDVLKSMRDQIRDEIQSL
jgi:phage gpG-like protein